MKHQFAPAKGAVAAGAIGVYAVGALALTLWRRLGAEVLIGRRGSATSAWVAGQGAVELDGEVVELAGRWRGELCGPEPLPELILVCPNADQLESFASELAELLARRAAEGRLRLEETPHFVLASSGLYFERFRALALRLARERAGEAAAAVLSRRLHRRAAYQAAVRRGRGPAASYESGREDSFIVLSLSGEAEDRERVAALLRGRGYRVELERRPGAGEFDKALANLLWSAFCQLESVEDGRLRDCRFGALPSQGERARRRARLIDAFGRLAAALGVYESAGEADERARALEEYILREIPLHQPSSFQCFVEAVAEGRRPEGGLLPTEAAVLGPLAELARRAGLAEVAAEFESFAEELRGAFDRALAARAAARPGGALFERRCVDAERLEFLSQVVAGLDRGGPGARLVGLTGLPGAGKSALAERLRARLSERGLPAETMSIDDFYYARPDRERLEIAGWGPGAHELSWVAALERLRDAGGPVALPRFDKSRRDRAAEPRVVPAGTRLLIVEGFGVGLMRDGYGRLSTLLDRLILLEADPELCRQWRRAAGWRDRAGAHGGRRDEFEREFDSMWRMIAAQAAWVMPEIERRADLRVRVGADHLLESAG